MAHFSKFIRPGAVRIGFENTDPSLMATTALNPDGSIAIVILNMNLKSKNLKLSIADRSVEVPISAQAIQTIVIAP